MAINEKVVNGKIAEALVKLRREWKIIPEATKILENTRLQPDITIFRLGGQAGAVLESERLAVLIESEFIPARNVEAEAKARLGMQIHNSTKTVRSAIALRLPENLKQTSSAQLPKLIEEATYEFALFTRHGEGANAQTSRFPSGGWIEGTLSELAFFAYQASIPTEEVEKAAQRLMEGVKSADSAWGNISDNYPDVMTKLSELLHQQDGSHENKRRMALIILINALEFHFTLAGFRGIQCPSTLKRVAGKILNEAISAEWENILVINYWPIFDIARKILRVIPEVVCSVFLNIVYETARELAIDGVVSSHDLFGRGFQRVIADRQFLATYYTLPPSATLLSNLAIPDKCMVPDYSSWEQAVGKYVIADFACGTGALLSAAYRRVAELYETAGGDMAQKHSHMMKNSLIGLDVLPSAVHLTAAMLSGMYSRTRFNDTRLFTVPYGKTKSRDLALGSLSLLDNQNVVSIFDQESDAAGGLAPQKIKTRSLEWHSCSLVIMNPPFTSSTSHEGDNRSVPNPPWAGFGTDPATQKALGDKIAKLRQNTCGHGNAGIGSDFVALADKMVCTFGTMAVVLPLSVLAGPSWGGVRALWASDYTDIVVVSIAHEDGRKSSFSSDTGMGEMLFVGINVNKSKGNPLHNSEEDEIRNPRGSFVMLKHRPATEMQAAEIARTIKKIVREQKVRCLEDGPYGGTPVKIGDEEMGMILNAPIPQSAETPWSVSRIADCSLAQTAYALTEGDLWLPRSDKSHKIAICKLGKLADRGAVSRDINGGSLASKEGYQMLRGPFDISPLSEKGIPTYPCLWAHNARNETCLTVLHDKQGVVRMDFVPPNKVRPEFEKKRGQEIIKERVKEIWDKASQLYHNHDFRFNSQALSVAFTDESGIGGRAWPNIIMKNTGHIFTHALWANSTLGLLMYWWMASKQQAGRGMISISVMLNMPVLDLTEIPDTQLKKAELLFHEIKNKPMLPMHRAHEDPVRAEIDQIVVRDILGLSGSKADDVLEGIELVRQKLSAEPTVRGTKRT